ncbi:MAG: hypothetical protein WBR15_07715 [Gammaproteobacteria bacterium]
MAKVGADVKTGCKRSWLITLVGLALALGCISLPFGTWDNEFKNLAHLIRNELIF